MEAHTFHGDIEAVRLIAFCGIPNSTTFHLLVNLLTYGVTYRGATIGAIYSRYPLANEVLSRSEPRLDTSLALLFLGAQF